MYTKSFLFLSNSKIHYAFFNLSGCFRKHSLPVFHSFLHFAPFSNTLKPKKSLKLHLFVSSFDNLVTSALFFSLSKLTKKNPHPDFLFCLALVSLSREPCSLVDFHVFVWVEDVYFAIAIQETWFSVVRFCSSLVYTGIVHALVVQDFEKRKSSCSWTFVRRHGALHTLRSSCYWVA